MTALAGTPLHELNAALERSGCRLHNMGDIAEQTLAGAISTGTHGTGGVVGVARPPRWPGSSWSPATATCCTPTRPRRPGGPRRRPGSASAPSGSSPRVTFRVEPLFLLEAHEGPMRWDEALGRLRRAGRGEPPRRDVLVPAHRPDARQAQQPHASTRRRAAPPLAGLAGRRAPLQHASSAGVNAVGNRGPAAGPAAQPSWPAGRCPSARYSDVAHRVFTSPRRVVFREMEYAVPARGRPAGAARGPRRSIERRGLADQLPGRGAAWPPPTTSRCRPPSGRDTVYLAFHIERARPTTRRTSRGVEQILRGYDGRPHWGKLHTRTAADLAPAYPRFARVPRAARPARPRPGVRQRLPAAGCSGARRRSHFRPLGPLCNGGAQGAVCPRFSPPRAIVPRPGPASRRWPGSFPPSKGRHDPQPVRGHDRPPSSQQHRPSRHPRLRGCARSRPHRLPRPRFGVATRARRSPSPTSTRRRTRATSTCAATVRRTLAATRDCGSRPLPGSARCARPSARRAWSRSTRSPAHPARSRGSTGS